MVVRRVNKRILILCEGMTEYLYALALQRELPKPLRRSVAIDIDHSSKNDPLHLLNEAMKRAKAAKRERNPYDTVWLFFDHDNSPHLQKVFELVEREQYHIAYTAICFEHWLVLHYENCGRAFQNADEAMRYLKKLWPEYHKTKSKAFEVLRDKLKVAIARADVLMKNQDAEMPAYMRNPHFTIPALVRYFELLKEKE
ncbi:hypothetical protein GCM10011386_07590 [Parapedobacter defluvii]|uniref:RloB domain-containing protein n=1 Tax=Parapedobacter defluvii TaxID=2045106 RepID=A0ABQ1L2I6_9SPHI|nr:RloB family protein [Parapedobacter defluvii]GGC18124.1 hypothetical protein GCM10011386_07590 [Parapedobacter defluvii]